MRNTSRQLLPQIGGFPLRGLPAINRCYTGLPVSRGIGGASVLAGDCSCYYFGEKHLASKKLGIWKFSSDDRFTNDTSEYTFHPKTIAFHRLSFAGSL